jgi:hypothetical protein
LFAEVFFAALAVELFLGGEDGGVAGAAVFDEVTDDAGRSRASPLGCTQDSAPRAAWVGCSLELDREVVRFPDRFHEADEQLDRLLHVGEVGHLDD